MRVQEPPPKRKKFEFELPDPNAKPKTYQEAFLRFLAANGDENSLSSDSTTNISTNANNTRKHPPRDRIYQNFFMNSSLAAVNKPTVPSTATTTTTTTTVPTTITTATTAATTTKPNNSSNVISSQMTGVQINGGGIMTTVGVTTTTTTTTPTHLDKENYYNSSRRENLTPLNSCEYRNSYKDVYDNQGVRINPAIIRSLQAAASTSTGVNPPTTGTTAAAVTTTTTTNSISSSPSKSSTFISRLASSPGAYAANVKTSEAADVVVAAAAVPANTNMHSDHTYKTTTTTINNSPGQQARGKTISATNDSANKTDLKQSHAINETNGNIDPLVVCF